MRRPRTPGLVDKFSNRLLPQGRREAIPNTNATGATFNLPLNNSGPSLIPHKLTIGSDIVESTFIFRAEDATASEWPEYLGRETLSITGSGDNPSLNTDAPFLDAGSIRFNAGRYYLGSDTSFANLGTDDFVLMVIFKQIEDVQFQNIIGKKEGTYTATNAGWGTCQSNNDRMRVVLADGSSSVISTIDNGGGTTGPWPWAINIITCNRNEAATSARGLRNYHNGVFTSSNLVNTIGNMDSTVALQIGNGLVNFKFAGAAMWQGANLFTDGATTITEADAVVDELNSLVMGIRATGEGTPYPSTQTRSSSAYLPVVNSSGQERWHYVGTNWMRIGSRLEADAIGVSKGYFCEKARTQQLVLSETMADGYYWTTNLATIVDGYETEVTSPVIGANVALLYSDSGSGQHYVTQPIAAAAAGVISIYAKKHPLATNDVLALGVRESPTRTIFYDFSTGNVASTGGPSEGGVVPCGNGWVRIWVREGVNDVFRIYTHDGSFTYNELTPGPQVYLCAPMSETISENPTSYIPNLASSGTVTRSSDRLEYTGDDGNIQSSESVIAIDFSTQCTDHDSIASETCLTLSDGGSGGDLISARIGISDEMAVFAISSESGARSYIVTGDASDGYQHNYRFTSAGTTQTFIDVDTRVSNTATNTMPNDLDRISVGVNRVGGETRNGLVSNITIYKKGKVV